MRERFTFLRLVVLGYNRGQFAKSSWKCGSMKSSSGKRRFPLSIIDTAIHALAALAAWLQVLNPAVQPSTPPTPNQGYRSESTNFRFGVSGTVARAIESLRKRVLALQKILATLQKFPEGSSISVFREFDSGIFVGYQFVCGEQHRVPLSFDYLFAEQTAEDLMLSEFSSVSSSGPLYALDDSQMTIALQRIDEIIRAKADQFARSLALPSAEQVAASPRQVSSRSIYDPSTKDFDRSQLEDLASQARRGNVKALREFTAIKDKIYKKRYVFESAEPSLRINLDILTLEISEIISLSEAIIHILEKDSIVAN